MTFADYIQQFDIQTKGQKWQQMYSQQKSATITATGVQCTSLQADKSN